MKVFLEIHQKLLSRNKRQDGSDQRGVSTARQNRTSCYEVSNENQRKNPTPNRIKDVLTAEETPESNAGHLEFPEQPPFQSDVQPVD